MFVDFSSLTLRREGFPEPLEQGVVESDFYQLGVMPVAEAVTDRATLAKQFMAYAFFNPLGLYTDGCGAPYSSGDPYGYIRDYCHHEYSDWTEGFRIYQRLGILSLGAGHSRKMDEILRRSQWLQSQELHGQRTPDEVKAKCSVRYENQALLF